MMSGEHLVAGQWVATEDRFVSSPVAGAPLSFYVGTRELVDRAVNAAEEAFGIFGVMARKERSNFLRCIAEEIEKRADQITVVGMSETGLPEARLIGERGRTTAQLRIFADLIENDEYLDLRHDEALPGRQPQPRPELKMVQKPIGPVAVFGASNFPLAFSTAGGDTASALAAGCPVIVKGHPAHPGTGEVVARAVDAAVRECGMPSGVFSFIQGNTVGFAQALVQHPLIRAVGFTGSLSGGRALFDLCAARHEPVPFFGELGSVNPVFVLSGALDDRGPQIAEGWVASLTLGAGQFCTNPGILIAQKGEALDIMVEKVRQALRRHDPQMMLSEGIAAAFRSGCDRIAAIAGVEELVASACEGRGATPHLYRVNGASFLRHHGLAEEVFGPLGLVVQVETHDEMLATAKALKGQLVCSIHIADRDVDAAKELIRVLERKAGRVVCNGYPTGVEIASAMVHGGPYPASTNFGHTSVGTLSIRRWLRPVCYQDVPDQLLPSELLIDV